MKLSIHPEIHKTLRPLTEQERTQLEANISEDGEIFDPILYFDCVTDGRRYLADGEHRHDYASRTAIKHSYKKVSHLSTVAQTIEWLKKRQAGRRNLEKAEIRKLKIGRAVTEARKNRTETSPDPVKSVASEAGVSDMTARRYEARAVLVDGLASAVKKRIENGSISVTDRELQALSQYKKKDQSDIAGRVLAEEVSSLTEAIDAHEDELATEDISPSDNRFAKAAQDYLANHKTSIAERRQLLELAKSDQVSLLKFMADQKIRSIASGLPAWEEGLSGPQDPLGNAIPEHLISLFENDPLDSLKQPLNAVKTSVAAQQSNPYLKIAVINESIADILRTIQEAKPKVVCPDCKGSGCQWCRASGWMPAWAYNDWKAKK